MYVLKPAPFSNSRPHSMFFLSSASMLTKLIKTIIMDKVQSSRTHFSLDKKLGRV